MTSKHRVQVIDGITYPREVPMPDGMPTGWKAIEQAYGPTSKCFGKTYTRYHSLDGRHRQILGPKQVVQAHCSDLGIPWEPEYAKYEAAVQERKDREAADRAREREARGLAEGERREEMIALSREHFGELSGPIVLGFPGWKCRWDYLPESQQTPKTFIAPDGREWKLLKDLECMFGTRLTQGGKEALELAALVEAGKNNTAAHSLFSMGSARARETQGSCLIDPARPTNQETETAAERQERVSSGARLKRQRTQPGGQDSLRNFNPLVHPPQTGWALLETPENLKRGFAEYRTLLSKRKFPEDVELIAVQDVAQESRFSARISGIYYQMGELSSGRGCYQKLLASPKYSAGFGCDGVYIVWNSARLQWQISTEPSEDGACVAYCREDCEDVLQVAGPWHVQYQGTGDFQEDAKLKITGATK